VAHVSPGVGVGGPVKLVEDLVVAFDGALTKLASFGIEPAPLNGDSEAVAACSF
jgi:hypothetical protein